MVSLLRPPSISLNESGATRRQLRESAGLIARSWALTSDRRRAILRMLAESGRISVTEIAERFEISTATARRDAVLLAITGRAVRRHGMLLPTGAFGGEQNFRARMDVQKGGKAQIALKAAQVLPHTGCVFVDAGTTCFEVGRLLLGRPMLRIVTNSIPLIALAPQARAEVIGTGGEVRRVSLALIGAFSQPWMSGVRFDVAVVGAAGLDLEQGAFTSEIHEAAIKVEALRRAAFRLLVADAAKWSRPATVHFAPWSAFNGFVSNQDLPRPARLALAAARVTLHLTGSF